MSIQPSAFGPEEHAKLDSSEPSSIPDPADYMDQSWPARDRKVHRHTVMEAQEYRTC